MDQFKNVTTVGEGILEGESPFTFSPGVRLYPAASALAAIELFSLHRIASLAGVHADALEFLQSSRKLSGAVSRTFFDPANTLFLPIGQEGRYVVRYRPDDLLPLVLDETFGASSRYRITESFFYNLERSSPTGDALSSLTAAWGDSVSGFVLIDLLSNLPEFAARLEAAGVFPPGTGSGTMPETGAPGGAGRPHGPWIDFWKNKPSRSHTLFPRWTVISSLLQLVLLLESEELLADEEIEPLKGDAESLKALLSNESLGMESHLEAIAAANRLLARISRYNKIIASNTDRWRLIRDTKWNRISPRVRRLISSACSASLADLMRAKAFITESFSRKSGLMADVRFPDEPVRFNERIPFEASLKSSADTFAISRLYLQIGEQRWKIGKDGERIVLAPGAKPFVIKNVYPPPPAGRTKIATLPVFFDLLIDGKRIEMHQIKSVAFTTGYQVTIGFPEGGMLTGGRLPVNVNVLYRPEQDIQGVIEGHILRELSFRPELPARFLLKSGNEITTLPLEIVKRPGSAPGRYPFSISVKFDGRIIARFEEAVVLPLRWLHLGPFNHSPQFMENANHLQDDISKTHMNAEGREIKWREVPESALDREGAVQPERLFGHGAGRCVLLYTVIDSPRRMKLVWKLETSTTSSLWINDEQILAGDELDDESLSGTLQMRKGINSLLIASCWTQEQDRILFEILDENGLPVSGISNEIDAILEEFEHISPDKSAKKQGEPSKDRLREVTLSLDYPDAADVCVIGTFNNWESGATPMTKSGRGIWTVTVMLAPGRYAYKFIIDRSIKIVDPSARITEPDGFGGENSILIVE
jgi:hypothetical protein